MVVPDGTLVANGSHMLTAIARDDHQETPSAPVPVTVSNPVATFTSSCTYLACSFTSTSIDPDGPLASYAWTFGDGGTSTLQNPSHTYAAGGTYTVTLTVTGNDGTASAPTSTPVTVSAAPLRVTVTGPTSVKSGATCTWVANASGGTPPYHYAWNPVGNDYPELTYTNHESNGVNFNVSVTLSDANRLVASDALVVWVTSTARDCRF
jgi:PKD repeat protein